MKKIIAFLLTLTLCLGLFAGCATGGEETKNTVIVTDPTGGTQIVDVKDPVTLHWWFNGNGIQEDTQKVNDAFNELLKTFPGMEHVTVQFHTFISAEYKQNVPLAQTANEPMDILGTVGLDFASEIAKGAYMPMNDLLDKYPNLKNELPQWLWDMGSVDGNVYMVPNYQRGANPTGLITPKVYMDKYGDYEKMTEVLSSSKSTWEQKLAVLDEYLTAVHEGEKANGKTIYAGSLGAHNYMGLRPYADQLTGNFIVMDGSTKVEHHYFYDGVEKPFAQVAEWYTEGKVAQDILSRDTSLDQANMMNDEAALWTCDNILGDADTAAATFSAKYGFECVVIPLHDYYYSGMSWAAGGNGIYAKCQHPEEAMRLLELLNTKEGQKLYNTVVYGLEGEHYVFNEDGTIKTLEYDGSQSGVDVSYGAKKWILGNTFYAYQNQGCTPGENEISLEINENAKGSILTGLFLDTSKIQTELSQIAAVEKEFGSTITAGVAGADWEAKYAEFKTKMEAAGLQKVLDELQSQVDAFLANQK